MIMIIAIIITIIKNNDNNMFIGELVYPPARGDAAQELSRVLLYREVMGGSIREDQTTPKMSSPK